MTLPYWQNQTHDEKQICCSPGRKRTRNYICLSVLFIELSFVQVWHHFFVLFAQIVDNNYSKHICCDGDLQTRGESKREDGEASTTEALQCDQQAAQEADSKHMYTSEVPIVVKRKVLAGIILDDQWGFPKFTSFSPRKVSHNKWTSSFGCWTLKAAVSTDGSTGVSSCDC